MDTVVKQAAARLLPRNRDLYSAATTGSASAEIAWSSVTDADGNQIGDGEMIAIQFSTKTHVKGIDATGEDTADTGDPYFEAGDIQEGFRPGEFGLVIYPTANGRVNIWRASRSSGG